MYEIAPIEIIAPAPRRTFSSLELATAYYSAVGVQSVEDAIILAKLIRLEMQKIHNIMDEVLSNLEADRQAEMIAVESTES